MSATRTDARARRPRSSPNGPSPGTPRPYDFPTVAEHRARQRPARSSSPTCPAGRSSRRRSCCASGAADEPADRGRRDGPRRPGPDRGHRALRRDRPDRGRRAARGLAPRRGRLGRVLGAAWTCPPTGSPQALGAARRGRCCGRPSRPPRSNGCATSGSTTCSRRRPTRDGAPRRPSSARSTRPASPYHRPVGRDARDRRGLDPDDLRARLVGRASTRRGPRSSSAATSAGQDVVGRGRAAVRRLGGDVPAAVGRRADRRRAARPPGGSSASSIGRAPSRPRSASAIAACRGASPTSTPCR